MAVLRSFIRHFNIPFQIDVKRNGYNKVHRTLKYQIFSIFLWILLIPLKVLDGVGFFYLIDLLRRLFIKSRTLSSFERIETQKVFGSVIDLDKIRISENSYFAKMGAKSAGKSHLGFVLFRTVNFTRALNHEENVNDMPWLIHELTHVVQFKYLGVQYIFDALRAQKNGGYSYGGVEQLKKGHKLNYFNLEQQADIAMNYYKSNLLRSEDVVIYNSYINQVQKGEF